MKIVIFEFEEWHKNYFDSLKNNNEVLFEVLPLSIDTVSHYATAGIITTFIKSDLNKNILNKFRNLKMIATRSTGFEHINLEHCKENKITLCNVPAYGENTIAEYVFALLLSFSRKIPETLRRTKNNNFSRERLQGFDLQDKTIGVIGTGNIGKKVVKIANGFGMNIIAHDLYPDEEFAKKLMFFYVTLNELLKQSDIISLNVPANKDTYNMIDQEQFSMMKDGAILINTSRGENINHKEMVKALKKEKISAAALDVLPNEAKFFNGCKDPVNTALLEMDNVYITPHNAYNTVEAKTRIIQTSVENIQSFLNGDTTNSVL